MRVPINLSKHIGWQTCLHDQRPMDILAELSSGRPQFNVANSMVDGVSGKLQRIYDWANPSRYLEQTDNTKQVAMPIPDSTVGNALSTTWAGTQYYDLVGMTTTEQAFMADGSGVEVFSVYRRESAGIRVICSTLTGGNVQGLSFYTGNVTNGHGFDIYKSGAVVVNAALIGTLAISTACAANFRHSTAESPNWTAALNGASSNTGNYSVAAGSGAVSKTLRLGMSGAGSFGWIGAISYLGFFPVLSTVQRATVKSCLQKLFNLTP